MPQVKRGSRGVGVDVPGVYSALLAYFRARYRRRGEVVETEDGREIRVSWYDKDDHSQGFFLWQRGPLDRLEAGESVCLNPGWVELALWDQDRNSDPSASRVRLPFGRGVRRVRVSLDDRIVPADSDGNSAR